MNGKHFYFKLTPPRATFPGDITPEERALMAEHAVYFQQQFNDGKVLLYGPVMALQGAFGTGVLEVADEAEARTIGENDPSVRGGLNRFEFSPMMVANARGKS
ncbi:MAG TPA: YciI family protein [Candidatus Angelobacter sp.]|nr:YciI family protein [Candidatus Angelobacter sp.]